MSPNTRRGTIRLVGLGLGAALAGCLDGGDDPATGESPTDDPSPTDGPSGDLEYESVQVGAASGDPDWYDSEDEPPGHVELFASARAVRRALDLEAASDEVGAFVDGTDFERSRLLYVASLGPNTCYSEIDVRELTVEDGELVGTAAAVDPSDDTTGCGDAVTFPSALVRVTFDGRPANHATITVVNGWDEQRAIEATVAIDPDDLPGHVRPDGDPPALDSGLSCDEESFERQAPGFDEDELSWGEVSEDGEPTVALRVNDVEFAPGDEVTVTLTTVDDETRVTGNRSKYSLQVFTIDGWQDVRGSTTGDPLPHTDEAVLHRPGDGFEWSLTLTEDGVVEGHVHEDSLTVCPGLPEGYYRFAFWEPAVAVAFYLRD